VSTNPDFDVFGRMGSSSTVGIKLKAKSDWIDYKGKSGKGTDAYGFSALPGGWFDKGEFSGIGSSGLWWIDDICMGDGDKNIGCMMLINVIMDKAMYSDAETFGGNNSLFSVRCVKD